MKFNPNVGQIDALIRYIIGVALLMVLLLVHEPWRWVGLLGVIPIATASINFCPVWKLLGINTKHQTQDTQSHPHVH